MIPAPPPQPPYCSVVEDRAPGTKFHKTLAHAKAAFGTPKVNDQVFFADESGLAWSRNTHGWGQIYQWVDGVWVLLYDVPQPTQADYNPDAKYGDQFDTRPWRAG